MKCHFCSSENVKSIFLIKDCPIAGNFISHPDDDELIDLDVVFCNTCGMAQIDNDLFIPKEKLFSNYFYKTHSIKTLVDYFRTDADNIIDTYKPKTVVEIGGNSCPLGERMAERGVAFANVDPSNVALANNPRGVEIINEFFTSELAERVEREMGPADVIYSANNFAHMEDIHDVVRGVQTLLSKKGLFIVQVQDFNYLLDELCFPFFYHEHLYYYTPESMKRFLSPYGFTLREVSRVPIHGKSIRCVFERSTDISYDNSFVPAIDAKISEFENRLDEVSTNISSFFDKIQGKKIVAYGASGQANIMFAKFGITHEQIPYIIDDAPLKQGKLTPYSHIPIKDSEFLKEYNPDYIFVTAYNFFNEIKSKNDWYQGTWVIPLPELREVNNEE